MSEMSIKNLFTLLANRVTPIANGGTGATTPVDAFDNLFYIYSATSPTSASIGERVATSMTIAHPTGYTKDDFVAVNTYNLPGSVYGSSARLYRIENSASGVTFSIINDSTKSQTFQVIATIMYKRR